MKKSFRLLLLFFVCIVFVSLLQGTSAHFTYGVLDRYTDNGYAVILMEDRKEEWFVEEDRLPEPSREGIWFQIGKKADTYAILNVAWKKTKKAEKKSQKLIDRLRSK